MSGVFTLFDNYYYKMNKIVPHTIFNDPVPITGQKTVLELKCDPLPEVRIAFIGLGMRISSAIKRFMFIDGVNVVALCDIVPDKVIKANEVLKDYNQPEADSYFLEDDWKKVCERSDVDLIYISTHYDLHTPIAVYAMQCGKHVAIEVPAATTIEECWQLVDTAEQTQRHCMMLENCNYGTFELNTLHMVQSGVLGEIIHGEGAYIHDLKHLLFNKDHGYWNMWRLKNQAEKNGNLYPTHGLGPVCHAMNIHRGDKLDYMVSMSTNQFNLTRYANETFGPESDFAQKEYRNGDMNTSILRTAKGKTILLQHDITSPRPYNRVHLLSGTKGFAQKWPKKGIALDPNGLEYISEEQLMNLMKEYEHPILKQINGRLEKYASQVAEIAKNEGMDYIMDFRLIYCLRNGLPLDQDVYDAAEWSSIIELSEFSVNNYSVPVQIPDFTRGNFSEIEKVNYYI